MKRSLYFFLSFVLIGLSVVPAVNLLSTDGAAPQGRSWWHPAQLYNFDFALPWLSRLLYPLGISGAPEKAVIGYGDWLYLGDAHGATRSATRRGGRPEDVITGRRFGRSAAAWERWLSERGVRLYRIMVAPNKGTLYPEGMPVWARPAGRSTLDGLMQGAGTRHFLDPRPELEAAKSRAKHPLFYRTDTHWNAHGAGIAFQRFAAWVGEAAPELRWPKFRVVVSGHPEKGDLARFLRLEESLVETVWEVEIIDGPKEVTIYDHEQGRVAYRGVNRTLGYNLNRPARVVAPGALNRARVLWLRDSFGTAISPLMAATFYETLQLHWRAAFENGGQRLMEIVERWRPDYVFVTAVERDFASPLFEVTPPHLAISNPAAKTSPP